MQNKGFIRIFSILLAIISLYYMSFTFIGMHYNNKANAYAKGDLDLKSQYLDSLSTEKVYMGYTLKEVRGKELGLGLDLKGGMNVVIELDVAGVLTALANTDDPQFNQAIQEASKQNRKGSSSDFLTLFQNSYEKINPNGNLANIFSITMSDRILPTATNDETISVLRKEVKSAADNSFNVLRTRIDRFGVVAPNIQRLDRDERILIELPGITEPERVRNLLQGSANLEFWKTYNVSELTSYFNQVNSKSADLAQSLSGVVTDTTVTTAAAVVEDSALVKDTASVIPALALTPATTDSVKRIEKSLVEYFAQPYFAMGGATGPVVGIVSKLDTASVNQILLKYKDVFPADVRFKWGFKPVDDKETMFELYALKGDGSKRGPALTGDVVTNARADQSQTGTAWEVSMTMNSSGSSRWATITGAEKGNAIAILLDGYVYSAPRVNDKIEGGQSSISGNFTPEEATDLENVLKSGKMRAGVRIVSEDIVGPSLGQESINAGLVSFLIALFILFIFTCTLYGIAPGMVINSALIINLFFTIGVLAAFQAVLTLAGIAGMILSLAMAVDANVLINERIKEELAAGKSLRKAIEDGYKNAFSAIFDSNLTTLITAFVLYIFGSGAIRGFAFTLMIGILISFLTAVFLTRMVYEGRMNKGKWQNLNFSTSFSRKLFNKEFNFRFIENRKRYFAIFIAAILIYVASLFVLKLNVGIDFTGGRNYVIRFDQPVKTGDIQDALSPYLGESVRVITIGSSNQVRVSTNYQIAEETDQTENEIKDLLAQGLKDYIQPGQTIDSHILSSTKVGPSIAEDMMKEASLAVLIALICMGLYIVLRFRNYTYSVGTVTALAIDAFSVIGLYSILWKVMPFSLEIDQTFVAAILTVIGYSINDKVVIFDRIRENIGLHPKMDKKELFNLSLNQTLVRTISTGISVILVILCILFFGGEGVRSFVFSMLIGIVVGTLTSMFIAAPLAFNMITKKELKEKN